MSETATPKPAATRPGAALAAAAYLLIAFEFFYMASPFALYAYSLYAPGLRWLAGRPRLAWLVQTFLPHAIVETRSAVINALPVLGAVVFLGGLLLFVAAAVQVYSRKLTRRGAATGGLYRWVRHPQYAALIVSGFGLLLLWPRFVAVLAFVVMFFVYRALASLEERECLVRFGEGYGRYLEVTPRFIPLGRAGGIERRQRAMPVRLLRFAFALAGAVALAFAVREWTLSSLAIPTRDDAVFVGVSVLPAGDLERIAATALNDPRVVARLRAQRPAGARSLNYALPADWFIPEIPMTRRGRGHWHPSTFDRSRYRVVFTSTAVGGARGMDIVRRAATLRPLFEVIVDAAANRVHDLVDPPRQITYGDVPVPII